MASIDPCHTGMNGERRKHVDRYKRATHDDGDNSKDDDDDDDDEHGVIIDKKWECNQLTFAFTICL